MRAELRLSDLKNRERSTSRLMNVKIPAYVSDAIQMVAVDLRASKTEVVIALLNEGLNASSSGVKGGHPTSLGGPLSPRVCSVAGCQQPYLARGYCATHYQASRRAKLKGVNGR